MTYYHPATGSSHSHLIENGFLSMETLKRYSNVYGPISPGRYDEPADCHALVCETPESAARYGRMYYGDNIEIVVLEIDGEYPRRQVKGTLVPEDTYFILGEIPPDRVRLYELENTVITQPASPRP